MIYTLHGLSAKELSQLWHSVSPDPLWQQAWSFWGLQNEIPKQPASLPKPSASLPERDADRSLDGLDPPATAPGSNPVTPRRVAPRETAPLDKPSAEKQHGAPRRVNATRGMQIGQPLEPLDTKLRAPQKQPKKRSKQKAAELDVDEFDDLDVGSDGEDMVLKNDFSSIYLD